MSHTVIGIFDHASEAQAAISCLADSGFCRENIDLSTRAKMERASSTPIHEKPYRGIISFFSHLFGWYIDVYKYSIVGQTGAIVTVHTSSEEQAQIASQLLDKFDALDVHERAETYQNNKTVEMQQEDGLTPTIDYEVVCSRIIAQVMEEEIRLLDERRLISESQVDITHQNKH